MTLTKKTSQATLSGLTATLINENPMQVIHDLFRIVSRGSQRLKLMSALKGEKKVIILADDLYTLPESNQITCSEQEQKAIDYENDKTMNDDTPQLNFDNV